MEPREGEKRETFTREELLEVDETHIDANGSCQAIAEDRVDHDLEAIGYEDE